MGLKRFPRSLAIVSAVVLALLTGLYFFVQTDHVESARIGAYTNPDGVEMLALAVKSTQGGCGSVIELPKNIKLINDLGDAGFVDEKLDSSKVKAYLSQIENPSKMVTACGSVYIKYFPDRIGFSLQFDSRQNLLPEYYSLSIPTK